MGTPARERGSVATPDLLARIRKLTKREREALRLFLGGQSSAGMSEVMSISPQSAQGHVSRCVEKLYLHDVNDLRQRFTVIRPEVLDALNGAAS